MDINNGRCHSYNDLVTYSDCSEEEKTVFREKINQILCDVAAKENFREYKITVTRINNKGGNYLGVLYKVKISEKKENMSKINIFIKTAIPDVNLGVLSIHDVYTREMFTYSSVYTLFNYLQEKYNIPVNESYKFVKCFGFVQTPNKETLIMDDLDSKGYVVMDRMKCVTIDFAMVAINKLAKFHALSYVVKITKPNTFDLDFKTKHSLFELKGEEWTEGVESFVKKALNSVDDKHQKEWVVNNYKRLHEKYVQLHVPTDQSVLCHGDYRGNNILVKFEEGLITDLVPIDYQLIYYGPPLNDFFYLLYTATDLEFRRQHLTKLLDYYYESLAIFLEAFCVDITKIYPKMKFDEDARKHRSYGFVVSLIFLQFVLCSAEDAVDMTNENTPRNFSKIASTIPDGSELYRNRLCDVIEEFMQLEGL